MRRTSLGLIGIALLATAALGNQAAVRVSPGRLETLASVSSLAPSVVGLFREPAGFEQVAAGHYLVFDRRGHAVYRVEAGGGTAIKLVQIGGEAGRVLEPSAFDAAPDGTFVVADAPNGRERVQVFNARGDLFSTFRLPGRANARVAIGALALNGVGTLAYTGESVVMNQPESGWLITDWCSSPARPPSVSTTPRARWSTSGPSRAARSAPW